MLQSSPRPCGRSFSPRTGVLPQAGPGGRGTLETSTAQRPSTPALPADPTSAGGHLWWPRSGGALLEGPTGQRQARGAGGSPGRSRTGAGQPCCGDMQCLFVRTSCCGCSHPPHTAPPQSPGLCLSPGVGQDASTVTLKRTVPGTYADRAKKTAGPRVVPSLVGWQWTPQDTPAPSRREGRALAIPSEPPPPLSCFLPSPRVFSVLPGAGLSPSVPSLCRGLFGDLRGSL